jgi:nucleotide-binding universal stress UspA family protein
MARIRNILVPTDFSPAAGAARQLAEQLALTFGARLHLLHVVPPPYAFDAWGTESAALRMADFVETMQQAARRQFERRASRRRGGPRVLTATAVGAIVDQILAYVRKHRVDLIVMGTHGRGRIERTLVGSIAEKVVRRAPVPVTVVPVHRRRG